MPKFKLTSVAFFFGISLIALLTIRRAFNLALGGDDWGLHWLIWGIFGVWNESSFFHPLSYFCTYCPHYFFLPLISRFFGYEPFYYFLASLLARIFVAFSLFLLIKKLTKRTLPAILAAVFFAVNYLGIEATDWAFNYNHILGVGLVAIFLIWYYRLKENFNKRNLLITAALFFLAAAVSPPRMHGLLPLLLIAELGWLLIEGRKFNFKRAGVRLLVIAATNYAILYGISDVYMFVRDSLHFEIGPYFVGNGYAAHGWNEGRVRDGLSFLQGLYQKGQSDFIIDPIATLGNFIMPDRLWLFLNFQSISFFGRPPFTFFSYIFPITLVSGSIGLFILYCAKISKKLIPFYLLCITLWMLFIFYLLKLNPVTFIYPRVAFALVGGFAIILTLWLFFIIKKEKPVLAHLLLVGFAWMNTFTLFPWLISPFGIIWSWGRYAVQQGGGLALWAAVIFFICIDSLKSKRRFTFLGLTYIALFLFVFMHFKFSDDYLAHVETYRSLALDNKYWGIITASVPSLDKNGLNIFLMITDQPSAEIAEAIRFGFGARSAIYYDIVSKDYTPFMVVNEYENILSSVSDGKYLLKQGRKPIPTTVDRIYAFALQNKEMINITGLVREKLTKDLAALKQGNPLPPP